MSMTMTRMILKSGVQCLNFFHPRQWKDQPDDTCADDSGEQTTRMSLLMKALSMMMTSLLMNERWLTWLLLTSMMKPEQGYYDSWRAAGYTEHNRGSQEMRLSRFVLSRSCACIDP